MVNSCTSSAFKTKLVIQTGGSLKNLKAINSGCDSNANNTNRSMDKTQEYRYNS
jgi:hypothetical protein